jgi:hypothetical protein
MKPNDLRRPVVLLLCCILAVAIIPSAQGATWHTVQSDDDPMGAPDPWHTNQTDSKTIAIVSLGWHTIQDDGSGIAPTDVGWSSLQTDSKTISAVDPGWYTIQSDSTSLSISDPYYVTLQEDQLVLGENGTGVLNSTIPSVLFQFGAFGTALIGLLFIGIMIFAIVGRFR